MGVDYGGAETSCRDSNTDWEQRVEAPPSADLLMSNPRSLKLVGKPAGSQSCNHDRYFLSGQLRSEIKYDPLRTTGATTFDEEKNATINTQCHFLCAPYNKSEM